LAAVRAKAQPLEAQVAQAAAAVRIVLQAVQQPPVKVTPVVRVRAMPAMMKSTAAAVAVRAQRDQAAAVLAATV
jgi:hypothetical protein